MLIGFKKCVTLCGPTAAQYFYNQRGDYFIRAGSNPSFVYKLLIQPNMSQMEGPAHDLRKEACMTAVDTDAMNAYIKYVMEPEIKVQLPLWVKEADFKMSDKFEDLLLPMFQRCILTTYEKEWGDKLKFIGENFYDIWALLSEVVDVPWTTPFSTACDYAKELVAHYAQCITEQAAKPGDYYLNDMAGVDKGANVPNGLSRILAALAKSPDGQKLASQPGELAKEIHHIVFAGQGIWTIAANLILNISTRPAIYQTLMKEIRANEKLFVGGLTCENVEKFQYMAWTVKESMRWSPEFVAINATCSKQCVYEDKYTITEGTWTVLMPGATSRDTNPWQNPSADDFVPERFKPMTDASLKWCYIPLGGGDDIGHKCLGASLAPMLSRVLVLYLLKDYAWEIADPKQGFDLTIAAPPPKDGLKVLSFRPIGTNPAPEPITPANDGCCGCPKKCILA